MRPEEITLDTQLCTIIGHNAQMSKRRKYFNKILKEYNINATAIALNIKDEYFSVTMQNVKDSKVTQMIIEPEFQAEAVRYCDEVNERVKVVGLVDFVEISNDKIFGYNLDIDIDNLLEDMTVYDEKTLLAIRMMLLVDRWYKIKVDLDKIPIIL